MEDSINPWALAVVIILIITLLYELSCEQCYRNQHSEYFKASHAGLIRGIISGCILGGFDIGTAINQGAMFGILNPFMKHMGY
jgi:hypothetical protein